MFSSSIQLQVFHIVPNCSDFMRCSYATLNDFVIDLLVLSNILQNRLMNKNKSLLDSALL